MKNLIFAVLASLTLSQAHALLPPLYQGAIEIKTILADDQLGQKLSSGEVIMKIEKTENGYEIVTNQHRLPIDVNYERHEKGWVGPAKPIYNFEEAVPLD